MAPAAGEALVPAAGEAEVVPEAGDWLAPAAGEAEVVPDAGEADLAPADGEAEVVPEAGDEDAAGLLLAPEAGDAPMLAGEAPDDDEAAGLCMTTAVSGSWDRQVCLVTLKGAQGGTPSAQHNWYSAAAVSAWHDSGLSPLPVLKHHSPPKIKSGQDCDVCRYRTDNNDG